MAPIEWKDEFSVGIAAVDHEHRELIGLVNEVHEKLLSSGTEGEVAATFGDLLRGIAAHFALEERFMREAGYDEAAIHKADHERLLDLLRDLMDQDVAGEEGAHRLAAAVEAWFLRHFSTHDARLHKRLGSHVP